MKSTRMAKTAAAVILVAALAVVASSVSSAATGSAKVVTISVASLIPGSTPEAQAQFAAQVKEFEKAHPTIHVNSVEYQWTGPTFAAKLAAGTLPTVFEVPFTDARTLGDNGQLADLTAEVKKLPYYSKYNPAVLAEGTTAKGKIVALPKGAYAQALHYNRKLFAQAGLDPNTPPTTWAQVRADARQIAAKTGQTGYAQMAKDDNTAGWILTTLVYALGGRMEVGAGTKARATLNNPQAILALNMLKQMRWVDNSMGSNFDYGWSDINQAFAAGTVGMYISGSDVYTNLVSASNIDPSIYGLAPIPLAATDQQGAGDPQRADARRGQAARRRPRAAPLQQGAVRPREHVDQAVHQRAAGSDEAVHERHLQADADPRAVCVDSERLSLARRGGGVRSDRQERGRRAVAASREQHRSGRDQRGEVTA